MYGFTELPLFRTFFFSTLFEVTFPNLKESSKLATSKMFVAFFNFHS